MLKKFYIQVSSATEFAAIKAALATKGIQVEKVVERLLKDYYNSKTDIGNYICVGGYGDSKEGRRINGIAELIPFLEAGDYKEKPKKFKLALTKVEIVEVEAFTEDEAKAKALQTKFPVIKTSTNVEIAR